MRDNDARKSIENLRESSERLLHQMEVMKLTLNAVDERLSCLVNQVYANVADPPQEPESERGINQPLLVKELWDAVNAYMKSKDDHRQRVQASGGIWFSPSDYMTPHLQKKLDALFRDLVLRQGPHPDATRPEGV